jgi:hypothetical protein
METTALVRTVLTVSVAFSEMDQLQQRRALAPDTLGFLGIRQMPSVVLNIHRTGRTRIQKEGEI